MAASCDSMRKQEVPGCILYCFVKANKVPDVMQARRWRAELAVRISPVDNGLRQSTDEDYALGRALASILNQAEARHLPARTHAGCVRCRGGCAQCLRSCGLNGRVTLCAKLRRES